MAVPALLLAVDREIYVHAFRLHPYVLNFLQLYKVVLGTGTVQNIYGAVITAVVEHVVDDRTQRCKTDAAGDKEQVLAL